MLLIYLILIMLIIFTMQYNYDYPFSIEQSGENDCYARVCEYDNPIFEQMGICELRNGTIIILKECHKGYYCSNAVQDEIDIQFRKCELCDKNRVQVGQFCYQNEHCFTNLCNTNKCAILLENDTCKQSVNCQIGLRCISNKCQKIIPYNKQCDQNTQYNYCQNGSSCLRLKNQQLDQNQFKCIQHYSLYKEDGEFELSRFVDENFRQIDLGIFCVSNIYDSILNACQDITFVTDDYESQFPIPCRQNQNCRSNQCGWCPFYSDNDQSYCTVENNNPIYKQQLQCLETTYKSLDFKCAEWQTLDKSNQKCYNQKISFNFLQFNQTLCYGFQQFKGSFDNTFCYSQFEFFFNKPQVFLEQNFKQCDQIFNQIQYQLFNPPINDAIEFKYYQKNYPQNGIYAENIINFAQKNIQAYKVCPKFICQNEINVSNGCIYIEYQQFFQNFNIILSQCPSSNYECQPNENVSLDDLLQLQNSQQLTIWTCKNMQQGKFGEFCYIDKDCYSGRCNQTLHICYVLQENEICDDDFNCGKNLKCSNNVNKNIQTLNEKTCQEKLSFFQNCTENNFDLCQDGSYCVQLQKEENFKCIPYYEVEDHQSIFQIIYNGEIFNLTNDQFTDNDLKYKILQQLRKICKSGDFKMNYAQCANQFEFTFGGYPRNCSIDDDCKGVNNDWLENESQCKCYPSIQEGKFCSGFLGDHTRFNKYEINNELQQVRFKYDKYKNCFPYEYLSDQYQMDNKDFLECEKNIEQKIFIKYYNDPVIGSYKDFCYRNIYQPNDWPRREIVYFNENQFQEIVKKQPNITTFVKILFFQMIIFYAITMLLFL